MPDSPQARYSRALAANQNAHIARSNALFDARRHQWTVQSRTPPVYAALPSADYGSFAWALFTLAMLALVVMAALVRSLVRYGRHNKPQRMHVPANGPYRTAPSLLTPTEAQFYATLREAVGPMAVIQCKVRLADLLLTDDFRAFRRVSQKHVDFVLCAAGSLRPLVAVELDDRSHLRQDRQTRDAFIDGAYAQAGLPIVHVRVQGAYNPAVLLGEVQRFLV